MITARSRTAVTATFHDTTLLVAIMHTMSITVIFTMAYPIGLLSDCFPISFCLPFLVLFVYCYFDVV